jgi:glycyl-tRNA synthetase (class II)
MSLRISIPLRRRRLLRFKLPLLPMGMISATLVLFRVVTHSLTHSTLRSQATITTNTCNGTQYVITPKMVTFTPKTRRETGQQITPGVIEPSFGIGRIIYSIFEHSYYVRQDDEKRGVLAFPPAIAPVKCSVLPLLITPELQAITNEVGMWTERLIVNHALCMNHLFLISRSRYLFLCVRVRVSNQ